MSDQVVITDGVAVTPPTSTGTVRRKNSRSTTGTPPAVTRVGSMVRFHPDTKQRGEYWAAKNGISFNEYVSEAVEEKIRRENLDYELPTLEIARLNQLIDEMKALSTNQGNLERILIKGLDSLLGLARGDNNYLLDEDGEL